MIEQSGDYLPPAGMLADFALCVPDARLRVQAACGKPMVAPMAWPVSMEGASIGNEESFPARGGS